MSKLGKLYEELIVQPGPDLPHYYQMVQHILQECKTDRGNWVHTDLWFRKWFGDS